MKTGLTLLSALLCFNCFAQREYLVEVNPASGEVTKHSTLADVNYISLGSYALDAMTNTYTFKGKDFNGVGKLYTVDLNNGEMLYNPIYTLDNGGIIYDPQGHLYTMSMQGTLSHIKKTAPAKGTDNNIIATIIQSYLISNITYDPIQEAIVLATDWGLHVIPTNNPVNSKQYSNSDNSIKGLAFHDASKKMFAISVQGNTASMVHVAPGKVTTLSENKYYYVSSTINNTDNKMIVIGFADIDSSNKMQVYTYSLPDGKLEHTANLPGLEKQDNFHSLAYSKSTDKYYMLHWDHDTTNTIMSVPAVNNPAGFHVEAYPNPFTNRLYVKVQLHEAADVTISISNMLGMRVASTSYSAKPGTRITPLTDSATGKLQPGIYFVNVTVPGHSVSFKVLKAA